MKEINFLGNLFPLFVIMLVFLYIYKWEKLNCSKNLIIYICKDVGLIMSLQTGDHTSYITVSLTLSYITICPIFPYLSYILSYLTLPYVLPYCTIHFSLPYFLPYFTIMSYLINLTLPYLTLPYHTIPYHTIPYHTLCLT